MDAAYKVILMGCWGVGKITLMELVITGKIIRSPSIRENKE